MISVSIVVKVGSHTKIESIDFDKLGARELSQVHDLAHTLTEFCERISTKLPVSDE